MSSESAAPQQRRRPRRRTSNTIDDVREAALTLFAERGYRATGIRDIAEALDIGPTSVYSHIESKAALLNGILIPTMEDLVAIQASAIAATADVTQQLRRVTEDMVLYFIKNQRAARVVSRDWSLAEGEGLAIVTARRESFRGCVEDLLRAGVEDRRFVVEDVSIAATAIIKLYESVAEWYSPERDLSTTQVAYLWGEYVLRIVKGA
ncbi:TetR/AcrR family transcriptional regulator [Nocardioides acrostichi]|uniref:TetR family transcriptional regulator n=1 Tax=Nocardioides acrostichi TaxID=2784339 RepID=A0A930V032_9ACTN|nr:TetR/AcrR family transcriptional regulator [Nocardioides acrostichi]MBF4161564.1 TetR family transcriptional regulator [Nocardioides acrostichi]